MKFLAVTLIPIYSFCQSPVELRDELVTDTKIVCGDQFKSNRQQLTKAKTRNDSLNSCRLTKAIKTTDENLAYLEELNLYSQIRAVGFATILWKKKKFLWITLKPHIKGFERTGLWIFYDNAGNKTGECEYVKNKLKNGCTFMEFDEKGNKIREYQLWIDE